MDWYKGDELLEDAGHVVIVDEEDGETFTLALEEASAEDSGTYKCVATNKAGTVTCTAKLKVSTEEPSEKDRGQEMPIEEIQPQQVEESNTQQTFDDDKTINVTIDGDSKVVTLPDDQTTMPEKQPKTSKEKPTTPDQKTTTPTLKPSSPKEKRSPPEKAPKVSPKKPSPKKPFEDKAPEKPKGMKPDDTERGLGREIGLTIDRESGVIMLPSEVHPKEEIGKQKSKKPQVAGEVRTDKEQPRPVEQDIIFTVDKDCLLMTTPDNLLEQEIPQKLKGKKPVDVEKTKTAKQKPFEQVGKEMSFTIDTEAGAKASPDIPSEHEIPQTPPKGKKPQVAEKTKPGKQKPIEPIGKEMKFTIDTEPGLMTSPDILSERPKKPDGKKPPVADKTKPGKAKPIKPVGKEMKFTIDTEAGLMTSPDILSEQPKKPDGKKAPVADKTKPGKAKPIKPVGKEMKFTIDTEAGLMTSPDILSEQPKYPPDGKKPPVAEKIKSGKERPLEPVGKEMKFTIDTEAGQMTSPDILSEQPKKPDGKKPPVAEKTKPGKEKPFESFGKEMSFTIDNEPLLQASPGPLPEQELKKPKGRTKIVKKKEPTGETRPEQASKKQKPQVSEKPEQRKPFETVGKPVSLTIDEGSLIISSPEDEPKHKQTLAPPIMKRSTKDKAGKPKSAEPEKDQKEQPIEKTRPGQPKDVPKVAPKTTKDKTRPPKEKSVKPTKDQQLSDTAIPLEEQPKDTSPKVETGEKALELRIDGGAVTITVPTEDIIIPQKESDEQFLAPESESDDILSPEKELRQTKDKPLSAPAAVRDKPKKLPLDSTDDDVGKLPYTTKREDGLPVWARRPRKPAKDETASTKKPSKPLKTASDKNKPDRQDVGEKKPEQEKVEHVEETPKSIGVDIGESVHVLLGPDQGVPVIQLKPKDQPDLKPKKAEAKLKEPEVKPKPTEIKQKKQPEVKPKKSEKGKKPVVERPGEQTPEVRKLVEEEKEKPVEPGKEVEFVFAIDTPEGEAIKPEEKPKDLRKPHDSIQDKKDKFHPKPEKNVPEWARKGRAKDAPPPVKPKTKPKSTDGRKVPGEVEIAPEDLHEPGVELREGESAQLKVQFETPPANVEWFKDGSKLVDKPGCTSSIFGDGCELLVRNVTPRDSGTYVCVVTSEAGRSTRTFQLVIEGKREDCIEV